MEKYAEIIKLLERIFGKGTIARSIGTRSNVVRFPKGPQGLDPTTRHFDVAGTAQKNPELVNTIKNSIEDRIGDLHNMNDQELLNYKQNLQRLDAHLNPPSAEVIAAGSKQPVTGEGLEKLMNEQGLKNSPKTIAGQLEQKVKQLEQTSKDLEKTTGQKLGLGDLLQDFAQSNKIYEEGNRQGLIRATARQILEDDINAGKIKGLSIENLRNTSEPINSFREIYGEDALEQLDSLTPEFKQLRTEKEAADLAKSKYKFEPNESRPKESYTEEEMNELLKKPTDPEEKADGGSIGLDYLMGFDNRPRYANGGDVKKILDIIAQVNKELKGKKAMELMNPKTGEITSPINPVKLAQEPRKLGGLPIDDKSADIADRLKEFSSKPIESLERRKQYLDLRSEFIDSLDPRRQNKNLDFQRKSIDTENRLILKAEQKELDFDTFEELRKRLYDTRKQQTLDFMRTGKVNLEPIKPATTFEDVQDRYKNAAKAHEEIFPNFKDPKTAAQELAEVMAEQKYRKGFDGLSGDQQHDLYSEAYDYITSVNRLPKRSPERVPPEVLEHKMNEVLNSYNKDMFIKNDQGLVDVTHPENVSKMEELLRNDHPELYDQLKKLGTDLDQKQTLEDFDITDRKPNKDGGLNYLLGF
jgi:hypothetical protein